eukprot:XP_001698392.1 predicted protein [Chlamydomonas reinhardtii]
MRRELVCALFVAIILGLYQEAEARPRSTLLPPGKRTSSRKSPPPRRAPPPQVAAVPESPSPPAPKPSPRSQAQPKQNPPPVVLPREGNGIRLVGGGGSGPRGRLEVSSKDGWLNEYEEGAVAWRPVCNMFGIDDSDAQVMCELLGYTYGRLYYDDEVNRRPPNDTATEYDLPIENLDCSPNHAPPTSEIDATSGARRLLSRRALRSGAIYTGKVDIPAEASWRCTFALRTEKSCDYTGPLVGVECSSPPSRRALLRTYGSGPNTYEPLESNLCAPPAEDAEDPEAAALEYEICTGSTRADLMLAESSGSEVMAALCAIDEDEELAILVADTVCKQMADYSGEKGSSGYLSTVLPSLQIPEADPSTDALPPVFQASTYANKWVTITGGQPDATYPALQQMDYTVGDSCASGRLFAFRCTYRST